MVSNDHGGKQMGAFLIKKGDYLCGLAGTHAQSAEHNKAKNLYLQAASWYKKGGATEQMNEAIQKAREQAALIDQ
ncbi:MAG: hypothetical protein ACTSUE_21670 [Promethearchaeota archaeon]